MSILYYLYLHQRVKKYIYYRQYRHTVGLLSASRIKKVRPESSFFASRSDDFCVQSWLGGAFLSNSPKCLSM